MSQYLQRVPDSNQDGGLYSGGTWTVSYFRLGQNVTAGLRFTSVNIPQGATVSSAYLTVVSSGWATGNHLLKVYGIDEDNTATMSSDPTGRTKTTANIDWDITTEIVEDTVCKSPDIKTAVQEILNRGSWSSGNAMGFLILDDGANELSYFEDYSDDSSKAALLEINYEGSSISSSISSSPSISSSISSSLSASQSPSSSISSSVSSSPSSSLSISSSVSSSASSSISSSTSSSVSASPSDDYGFKVSKAGYDVNTETDIKNMVFTSSKGVLGLAGTATYTDTTNASGDINEDHAHGFGYVPVTIGRFTTISTEAPNSLITGVEVNMPVTWHSYYLTATKETIEITETATFYLDATNIRIEYHGEAYNHDTTASWDLDGQDVVFNIYYYFNELVETV